MQRDITDKNLLWETSLKTIKENLPEAQFNTWMSGTHIVKVQEGVVTIGVQNEFAKSWLSQKYLSLILNTIRENSETVKSIRFVVSKKQKRSQPTTHTPRANPQEVPLEGLGGIDHERKLNTRYTFKSFVIAPYNDLAVAAAQAVVDKPGLTYNPFFLYGESGIGKTHLIQAVGNKIALLYPELKVLYVTSETYAGEFYRAVQDGSVEEFKQRYRSYDVLLIDDVQFFDSKTKTMEVLTHLFNDLYDNNKQVILSADQHPNEICGLEQRLRSRFSSGMMMKLEDLDIESTQMIFERKAAEMGLELDKNVVDFVIKNMSGGIRAVEGIVKTMSMYKTHYKRDITLSSVKNLIECSGRTNMPTFKDVCRGICTVYEIHLDVLKGNSRKRDIVEPRQVMMFILRDYLNLSYSSIGSKLGGKDHTTVIHSCEKIRKGIKRDLGLKGRVEEVKKMLNI